MSWGVGSSSGLGRVLGPSPSSVSQFHILILGPGPGYCVGLSPGLGLGSSPSLSSGLGHCLGFDLGSGLGLGPGPSPSASTVLVPFAILSSILGFSSGQSSSPGLSLVSGPNF